jgi:hypothetical protein
MAVISDRFLDRIPLQEPARGDRFKTPTGDEYEVIDACVATTFSGDEDPCVVLRSRNRRGNSGVRYWSFGAFQSQLKQAKLIRFSDQLPIDWDAVQRVPHGQMG